MPDSAVGLSAHDRMNFSQGKKAVGCRIHKGGRRLVAQLPSSRPGQKTSVSGFGAWVSEVPPSWLVFPTTKKPSSIDDPARRNRRSYTSGYTANQLPSVGSPKQQTVRLDSRGATIDELKANVAKRLSELITLPKRWHRCSVIDTRVSLQN